MQQFSNAGQDEPEKIHAEAAKFMPAAEVPSILLFVVRRTTANHFLEGTPEEFFKYNFGYDVVKDSQQTMRKEYPTWELPKTFFEIQPGEGVYPWWGALGLQKIISALSTLIFSSTPDWNP